MPGMSKEVRRKQKLALQDKILAKALLARRARTIDFKTGRERISEKCFETKIAFYMKKYELSLLRYTKNFQNFIKVPLTCAYSNLSVTKTFKVSFCLSMPAKKRKLNSESTYAYPGLANSSEIEQFTSTESPPPPSLRNFNKILKRFRRGARGVNRGTEETRKKKKKKCKSKKIVPQASFC